MPIFFACVTRISIVAFGRYERRSERRLISFAATALRLNGQPFPMQRIRTRVPFGVLTVTRVSVVRVPLKRPAMRMTGNGLMNESVVAAGGVDPPPVWVPELNVPLPGPVGVTFMQVSLSPTFGIPYGFRRDERGRVRVRRRRLAIRLGGRQPHAQRVALVGRPDLCTRGRRRP